MSGLIEIYKSRPVVEILGSSSPSIGGGSSTFLALTDTPSSYVGQSLKGVRVNSGETGLEFYTTGGGGGGGWPLIGSGVQTGDIEIYPLLADTGLYDIYIGQDIATVEGYTNNVYIRSQTSTNLFSIGAISLVGDSAEIFGGVTNIKLGNNPGDFLIEDNRATKTGIQYSADYSANYTSRSLVDQGYVVGLTGATGAWKLASGGTLTASNTITANTANWLNFTGTWTATANNQFAESHGGTLTTRNTASDDIYGHVINYTINRNAGAPASQRAAALYVNPTIDTNIPNRFGIVSVTSSASSYAGLRIMNTSTGNAVFDMVSLSGGSLGSSSQFYIERFNAANGAVDIANSGTGLMNFKPGNVTALSISSLGNSTFTQSAQSSGWGKAITSTPGAHTALTSATEFISRDFQGAAQTWIDGTVATQRFNYFKGYTLNKTTTSATFTNAYTVYIEGNTAGTGVTISNNYALGVTGNVIITPPSSASLVINNDGSNNIRLFSGSQISYQSNSGSRQHYFANLVGSSLNGSVVRIYGGNQANTLTSGSITPLYVEDAFTVNSGTATLIMIGVYPTFNTTSTYAGIAYGIDYNPTLTSTTGLTHYAFRSTSGSLSFTQEVLTAGWIPMTTEIPGAHTGLTATTEFNSRDYRGASQQWLAGTTATQRFNYFKGFTVTGASATATFTDIYTVYIEPSTAGSNAAITNNYALGLNGSMFINGNINTAINAIIGPTGNGALQLRTNNTTKVSIANNGSITYTGSVAASGNFTFASWTSPAHTNQTASTEETTINFNLSATVQFATGAIATQRAFRIQNPTYRFVGASTITDAYTVYIDGAPVAGTNATITNSWALGVNGNATVLGTLVTAASASAATGLRITPGAAPSSPVNGDIWLTTNQLLIRTSATSYNIGLHSGGYTSSRIVFGAGTGTTQDSANLTFNGTLLTVTGSASVAGTNDSLTISTTGNLSTAKSTVSASSSWTFTAATGISGATTGQGITITGGAGFASGNTNGGNITILGGAPNASGTPGNIAIGSNSQGGNVSLNSNLSGGNHSLVLDGTNIYAAMSPSSTNTILDVFSLVRLTSGTAANGIGARLTFQMPNGSGSTGVRGSIECVATDVTAGSEDWDTVFRGVVAGAANTEHFRYGSNKIGFFAVTSVARQTSGANLTNNVTAGGTTDQIDDFTSLSVYATDAATIRNNIYQLARKLKQVNDALRAYGLLT